MNFAHWFASLSALALTIGAAQAQTLVIVGGGLSAENAPVYRAFIDALPDAQTDRIAIIAAASVEPAQSAQSARAAFARHGVSAERVVVLPLAAVDDPSTPDIDESAWSTNHESAEIVAALNEVAGVWFTGGDQLRAMRVLQPGPVLDALHAVLTRRGVLGGTSAGAALMSDPMIARGDVAAALTLPPLDASADDAALESGALLTARGAGFFRSGLVDQHFDRDLRLGRLIRAMALSGERRAYGVDEDTALVVDLRRRRLRVVGEGAVMALDARAMAAGDATPFSARNVRLLLLRNGDTIGIGNWQVAGPRTNEPLASEGLSARLWRAFKVDGWAELNVQEAGDAGSVSYTFTRLPRVGGGLTLSVSLIAAP